MRISVSHATVYRYSEPVHLEPHTFRLRPREDGAQHLVQHALSIAPAPAGRAECLDAEGNVVVEAWFDDPVRQMWIQSAFMVETQRENPFDFLPRAGASGFPVEYPEALRAVLQAYLGEPPSEVRQLAAALARDAADPLDFLASLNRKLSKEFRYITRDTGAPHPAEWTLHSGEGSCRDLAVLFCEAARAVGIAARFVSGYQSAEGVQNDLDMHAWAEVYLEGGGWRGYDPSAGLAVGTSHVAVAAAADPAMAAPVTGSFRGSAEAAIEYTIAIQAGR